MTNDRLNRRITRQPERPILRPRYVPIAKKPGTFELTAKGLVEVKSCTD